MGADAARLRHALCALLGADRDERVQALQRLSGGANMETWAFDLDRGERVQPLILRRRPPGLHAANSDAYGDDTSSARPGLAENADPRSPLDQIF